MSIVPGRAVRRAGPGAPVCAVLLLLMAAWHAPAGAQDTQHEVFSRAYFGAQPVILYPGDYSTVFDNDGAVNVHVVVPPLRAALPGERVELLLDGRRIARRDGQDFVLRNLKRGMHLLQARIVTAGGATIAESRLVRFYQWHAPLEAQAENASDDGSARRERDHSAP